LASALTKVLILMLGVPERGVLPRSDHKVQVCCACDFIVNHRDTGHPKDVAAMASHSHIHHEAVAWNNRTQKPSLVNPGEVRRILPELTGF
jgi:hypothetical protein